MTPVAATNKVPQPPKYLPVMLDGLVLGYLPSLSIPAVVVRLRSIKAAKLAQEETAPAGAKTIRLNVSLALRIDQAQVLLKQVLCVLQS